MALKFRTELRIEPRQGAIDHSSRILLLGSCFSDEIGSRLIKAGFDAVVNPTGTLYNPMSIAAAVERFAGYDASPSDALVYNGGLWHSMDHHTRFSSPDRETLMDAVGQSIAKGAEALHAASHLIITLGSAYVYEFKDTGRVVANCHKLPADRFERRRLDIGEITDRWRGLVGRMLDEFPDLEIIFTVSPIRHVADGLHGNQLSKATLHLAIDRIVAEFPGRVSYFPAYEALVDDLRDYRFYAEDLVHPSSVGVEYVYSLVAATYFNGKTRDEANVREKEYRRQNHRPLQHL